MAAASTPAGLIDVAKEDFLDQDPELRGQKYACVSFVSPEDALRNKEAYKLSQFLTHLSQDVNQLLDNLVEKFKDDAEVAEMARALRERHDYLASQEALEGEYRLFSDMNSARLEAEFYEQNQFRTSIRGIKIRGVFETLKEAQKRAETIRTFDKLFDVWIAEVGCWCPWNPNVNDVESQEFPEAQLNTLMSKYKENQERRDQMYNERKQQMVKGVQAAADKNRPEEEARPSE